MRCNNCVCSAGQWDCSEEKCAAQCLLLGITAVNSFDLLYYEIEPTCQNYRLVDHKDFKIDITMNLDQRIVESVLLGW